MFEVPASPKLYTEDLVNFLGVDYTSIAPAKNRATEMRNLINNDGYLETRPGFDEINSFGVASNLNLHIRDSYNLIDLPNLSTTSKGITMNSNDNVITFTGTYTEYVYFALPIDLTLKPGTYTMSIEAHYRYPYLQLVSGTETIAETTWADVGVKTFTITEEVTLTHLRLYIGSAVYAPEIKVMLNEGSTAMSFEKPRVPITMSFTSIRKGEPSNDITIEFKHPNKANKKLSLEEADKKVVINLATDKDNNVLTTLGDICALESKYVTMECSKLDEVASALEPTYLTGGVSYRINGLWNYDEKYKNVFIVHVKDQLYRLDSDFKNPELMSEVTNLNDELSEAVFMADKLFIFDGKKVVVYGAFDNTYKAVYLDGNGTIPTTSVNRKPDGTGASSEYYESPNLLQPLRINSFVTDGTSATYTLESPFDSTVMPIAQLINENTGLKENLPIKTFDADVGTVTFETIPPKFAVTGRDSLFITFKPVGSMFSDEYSPDLINKCKIATTYGYDGNNNRIFVSGNPDYPNVDWFSQYEDPMYYPADNFTKIGTQPIVAYSKLNDGTLAVQKATSDTDFTTYYRRSALYNGQEVFPISAGVKSLGCLTRRCNSNLVNDPLTLTELGVYGIKGSSYGEKFQVERSYFVKRRLLEEPNLQNAVAIAHNNLYYLAVNNHVYVADARYKSRISQASGSDFQYEWYYWDDIPVRNFFTFEDELYFYTDTGDICKFNNTVLNYNIPIKALFETAFLDLGTVGYAKTVKRVSVITRPFEDSSYTLSYATVDGDQDITVRDTSKDDFLSTLHEKEKIKKCMFVKFRLSNENERKMNFYRIAILYILAGRYRGD